VQVIARDLDLEAAARRGRFGLDQCHDCFLMLPVGR
jgi:hypothetical protein